MAPTQQGTPFVEDAAVPAANLPALLKGFATFRMCAR
ncbi:hypothetical protein P775_22280 [Puniceibacterium antarcticum]|uniref:Uncharacterized protein n=1 Tax=Puniceibacterium antarcticum TaxID=1206336 RepID=A0A2G8R8T2_9RHOB|nr:hypothetical protein P775_22280 [Puniceibacterium antarcticum]